GSGRGVDGSMRRALFSLLGGAAACPRPAAPKPPMPVVGYLNASAPTIYADDLRAFRTALKEVGYVEGENVAIEYRWGDNDPDRLRVLTDELVRRRVSVIVASSAPASLAAAKATTTIPVVFIVPE